jgi:hypothetical protein
LGGGSSLVEGGDNFIEWDARTLETVGVKKILKKKRKATHLFVNIFWVSPNIKN